MIGASVGRFVSGRERALWSLGLASLVTIDFVLRNSNGRMFYPFQLIANVRYRVFPVLLRVKRFG
jgi:hypothetical protein